MIRSRVIGTILMFFAIFMYIFSDSYFAFFLIVTTVVLFIFSFMIPFIIKNKVIIKIDNKISMYKRQRGLLNIRVENRSFLPISKLKCHLEINNPLVDEKYSDYFYTTVRGKSTQSIPIHLRSEYVGKVNVKVTGTTAYDYFGVFALFKQMNEQTALFVLPRAYDIELLGSRPESILSEFSLSTGNTKGMDTNDIIAIKEYEPGESLKHIHWKLSSKLDELLVKEMNEVITSSQFILLETAVGDVHPNEIDAMIDAFYSLSKAMIKSERTHYIGWFDHKYKFFRRKEIHSLDQLNDQLQEVLSISFKDDHQSSLAAFLQNTHDIKISQLIYITSSEENLEILDGSIHMITIRCTSYRSEESVQNTGDTICITPDTLEGDLQKLPI